MTDEAEMRRPPSGDAARSGDRIAQAFEGFESPLPSRASCLRVILIVPRLLIRGPQREKMVDDHEYFVGNGQRRLLLTDTDFETPKGASEEGGRFPGPVCTKTRRR